MRRSQNFQGRAKAPPNLGVEGSGICASATKGSPYFQGQTVTNFVQVPPFYAAEMGIIPLLLSYPCCFHVPAAFISLLFSCSCCFHTPAASTTIRFTPRVKYIACLFFYAPMCKAPPISRVKLSQGLCKFPAPTQPIWGVMPLLLSRKTPPCFQFQRT